MAESTLSLALTALRQDVGHYFGYGRTVANWSTEEGEDIDVAVAKGQRQFYFPAALPGLDPNTGRPYVPHKWSFMTPIDTLTTIATYSTGTVTVSSGTATIASGTWPTWAFTNGSLTIDTTEYEITSRDSGTELTVVGDDVVAATEFTLDHNGTYDLPDDFGDIRGDLTYEPSTVWPPIRIVGEGAIRAARQQGQIRSRPTAAAIRPKSSDLSSGQRFEILLEPIPDAVYVLTYRKSLLPDAISNPDNTFHLGGMIYADTVRASCVAAAEMQSEDKKGSKWQDFVERLQASVAYDQEASTQDFFGYNGDNSDPGRRYGYGYRGNGNDCFPSRVRGLAGYVSNP